MSAVAARGQMPWRPLAVAVAAWLLLGVAGGIAALAVAVWTSLGSPTRTRVLALAGLSLVVVTIGWLADGVPSPMQIAVFTNAGGRDWLDATTRAAMGLFAAGVVLPDTAPRALSSGPRDMSLGAGSRLPEVDRLRGIAIVTVVFIHALPFRAPVTDYLDYWLSDVTRFSVATLVFLSGWLVVRDDVGWTWLGRRLARLLPPYLVASVAMMTLARLTPAIDARPVLQSLVMGDAVGPYYYVFVLVVLTVVTPVLVRLGARTLWWLLGAAAAGSLAIEVADLSLYAHNHLPLTWLPYYLAGMLLRRHRTSLQSRASRWEPLAIGACGLLVVALGLAPIETSVRRVLTWLTIWAILAALLLVALGLDRPTSRVMQVLSLRSYLIYLYHPPIVAGLAGVFGSSIMTGRPVTATITTVVVLLLMAQLARIAWPRRSRLVLGA